MCLKLGGPEDGWSGKFPPPQKARLYPGTSLLRNLQGSDFHFPFRKSMAASPAATTPIPLPRASLSFLVKQPGGLGLHSMKCSKCKVVAVGNA